MSNFDQSLIIPYTRGVEGANADNWNVFLNGTVYNVVRLTFTTGDIGANGYSFDITRVYNYNNPSATANTVNWAFAISDTTVESINKYKNYNGEGDGTIAFEPNSGSYYNISGSVKNKILMPNTTYYLWLFPNDDESSTYGFGFRLNTATALTYTLEGSAGIVWIDTGDSFVQAIPYLDDGTEWHNAIPYIDNGSSWDICC